MGPSREIKTVPIILLNCSRKRFRFLTAQQCNQEPVSKDVKVQVLLPLPIIL
jgi:hypothetical protein